ncbi:Predicted transcriptional regulator [Mucinivorans hirudinis]|uniref:Predicted transcriptional regulator n=1 Tax=Mucinivorans hirudinis TaxID=1433126 RepID=A0A060R6Y4_9BACT|nr:Predicted transcriptional regulator [Mucinivorans hirudinis]
MNRIDRISAMLIQLQSRPVVRAADMAERFGVSIRTVYRDVRSLCEAGVPICGDSGVGYSLVEGYRLPPLMFTKEEALAFVTAGKFVEQLTDEQSSSHFRSGMEKIRAVLRGADKSDLADVGNSIAVYRNNLLPNPKLPNLIQTILSSVHSRKALDMRYFTPSRNQHSDRLIEAVGVSYIYPHWYLSGYCHLRSEYRNFRLDRIEELTLSEQPFTRQHPDLGELGYECDPACLTRVVLHTTPQTALQMGDRKYYYGLISEVETDGVVEQTYMSYYTDSIARWALSYIDTTKVIEPEEVKEKIKDIIKHF